MKLSTNLCGCLMLLALVPSTAAAQAAGSPSSDGISVYGTGEVGVEPNLVEIDLSISGRAELTGDALVKFRDSKKRLQEALDKLKLEGLESEEVGLRISAGTSPEEQQRIMQGMPQMQTKPQIEVSSVLRVRLKNVRGMATEQLLQAVGRLLDVAQDSGVSVGPTANDLVNAMRRGQYGDTQLPIRFVVSDLAELREKAYEMAVNDARSRATRLAKLNGVKLGATRSVQEVLVAGDSPAAQTHSTYNYGQPIAPVPEVASGPRVVSSSLTGIPIQVKLLVRFAIEPVDPATAQN